MALYHLLRQNVLLPGSSCHQIMQQTAKPLLKNLFTKASVHLDLCNQQSQHFLIKRLYLSSCFQHGCQQRYKPQLVVFGTKNPNILSDNTAKHLVFSPIEKSQLSKAFSTSAVKSVEQDIGNSKSSVQSFFNFLSVNSLKSTPTPYMIYGICGLIPFMSVPAYMLMTSYWSSLAYAQLAYGACILSFLGGVAWGRELNTSDQSTLKSLGYSVSLPLIGWLGVVLYPSVTAFPIMISGIAFAGYYDTQVVNYPEWFKNLRFLLSSLVILSLFITYLMRLFCKKDGT